MATLRSLKPSWAISSAIVLLSGNVFASPLINACIVRYICEMTKTIVVLNGPNLNMLGTREPSVYGSETLEDIRKLCEAHAQKHSIKLDFRQSNHEGELVTWIQEAGRAAHGLIINPAGFGHTSVALMDGLLSIKIPAIEVHLSNIYKREEFRHHTYTSRAVHGVISGMGSFGYTLAIEALANLFKKSS